MATERPQPLAQLARRVEALAANHPARAGFDRRLRTARALARALAAVEEAGQEPPADDRQALASEVEALERDVAAARANSVTKAPSPQAPPVNPASPPLRRAPKLVGAFPSARRALTPPTGDSAPSAPRAADARPPTTRGPQKRARDARGRARAPETPAEREARIAELLAAYEPFLAAERRQQADAEQARAQAAGVEPLAVDPLPVLAVRERLAAALREHRVVLLQGETGSGKTLLAPFIALIAGFGRRARIAHTQPRRVAARQVARRLAQMSGSAHGTAFGCHTRHDSDFGPATRVMVCTDGILLQELKGDPELRRYDCVILDEAHERSVNIDLILGLLRALRERRPELALLVTSATIEQAKFRRFLELSDAQVVQVQGRRYPVEVRHVPPPESLAADPERLPRTAATVVRALIDEGVVGDMLVFMPRAREIRATMRELTTHGLRGVTVLPMHGALAPEENERVFRPHTDRVVVVATNIAETSITVPGIRVVIDSGLVNLKRFNPKTGIATLRPVGISAASATQRLGRAGRVAPGLCVKLYGQAEAEAQAAFPLPEIQRADLAQVVLTMHELGIDRPARFAFVDAPDARRLAAATRTLTELGALDAKGAITPLGRQMARLPVDPRLARLVLAADSEGCVREVVGIAACLAVERDLFVAPRTDDERRAIDAARKRFSAGESDFIMLANIWDGFTTRRGRERETFCARNHLSRGRLEEARVIFHDLREILHDAGIRLSRRAVPARSAQAPHTTPGKRAGHESRGPREPRGRRDGPREDRRLVERIHRAILAGLVEQVCVRADAYAYVTGERHEVYLHPSSVLFDATPRPALIVARALETGEKKTYARLCAPIAQEWLEALAPQLMSATYRDIAFDRARGSVRALETLYFREVTLVEDRPVDLFTRDPARALMVLIEEGLLSGALPGVDPSFALHNAGVLAECEALATRLVDPELAPDESAVLAWYAERLAGCRTHRAVAERLAKRPRTLFMRVEDFISRRDQARAEALAPAVVTLAGERVAVRYEYNPFRERTRVVLTISAQTLARLGTDATAATRLSRLIPGLAVATLRLAAERLVGLARTDAAGGEPDAESLAEWAASADWERTVREDGSAPLPELFASALEARMPRLAARLDQAFWQTFWADTEQAAGESGLRPVVEVRGTDNTRVGQATDVGALRRLAGEQRRRAAWDAARAQYESAPTDRLHEVWPLMDGLLATVPVRTGDDSAVAASIGLEEDRGGFARRLFRSEAEAVTQTNATLGRLVRMTLKLDSTLGAAMDEVEIPEDLGETFYRFTGAPDALPAVLGRFVTRLATEPALDAEALRQGAAAIRAALDARIASARRRLPALQETVRAVLDGALRADRLARHRRTPAATAERAAALVVRAQRELRALDRMSWEALVALGEALAGLKAEPAAQCAPAHKAGDSGAPASGAPASGAPTLGAANDAASTPARSTGDRTPAAPDTPEVDPAVWAQTRRAYAALIADESPAVVIREAALMVIDAQATAGALDRARRLPLAPTDAAEEEAVLAAMERVERIVAACQAEHDRRFAAGQLAATPAEEAAAVAATVAAHVNKRRGEPGA